MNLKSKLMILAFPLCFYSFLANSNEPDLSVTEPELKPAPVQIPLPQFGGLLQIWALHDSTNDAKANFRIRRAEIKVSGDTTIPTLRYFVMVDPSKSIKEGAVASTNDNKILQDAGIAYKVIPELELTVGQFKIPTTAEGLVSSAEILLPERALISRFYGDKRQLGAMAAYKPIEKIKLSVMGSNGGSPNTADDTTNKDLHARIEFKALEHLIVGTYATLVDSKTTKSYSNGANFAFDSHRFTLAAEGVLGKNGSAKVNGFYADLSYDCEKKLKPVLRYEYFKNDQILSHIYSAGLSYSPNAGKAKIQLAYSYLKNATTDLGTARAKDRENGNLVVANFQIAL